MSGVIWCLNAPSGAGCSLTKSEETTAGRHPFSLNAPSGAGCSLTLLLGGAWLQRFQGLDRHRPCGALPAGGWSTSFLAPFVGMTPLATDGPGSGSGAGFGRDHAEKWQSDGVSRTTSMVTKTTSLAGLDPASPRTCALSLTRSPPVQAPVIERGRRAVDPHPSRTGHVQSRDRPRRRTPLQRGQNRIEWFVRSRPGSRKRYPPHT